MKRRLEISIHLAGTVLLLSATLMAARLAADRKPEPLLRPLETINWSLAGFTGSDDAPLDDRTVSVLRPTSYLVRTYTRPDLVANLFLAFYAEQRAGESMHSPKHCLPGAGWEIWNYGRAEIPVGDRIVKVNQYSISKEGERSVVLYWYQSKNRIVANEYLGKLLLARDTLLQHSTSAAIVRIIVPDRPAALAGGRDLAAAVIPQLQHCFE